MNTPIVDFVKKYSQQKPLRLHMPGHKGNNFSGHENADITEIDGADVLYSANGIIKQSEENAATLFETQSTFYSAEGSSLSIRAMLYLIKIFAVQQGKNPLIAAGRNAHKTFINACAVLDIKTDWLLPQNTKTVISCVITADFLENYLKNAAEKPVAVYITSPDYLGNITDIKALSAICRKYGVLLLVDNAHGAYLKFLNPDSHPITLGADMCCDSAHKTLPVLTGGAYLHVSKNAPQFLSQNAQRALSLFASTSPSYLILQSLDAANHYLSDGYANRLACFLTKLNALKTDLTDTGYCLTGDEPLKLTVMCKPYGYTGFQIADILAKNNIFCEFSDPDYVVMMFTTETPAAGLKKLKRVLLNIPQKNALADSPPQLMPKTQSISLKDAVFSAGEWINTENSFGRISAMTDFACPPAVPVCIPGEKIDGNTLELFKYYNIDRCFVITEKIHNE